MTSDLALLTAVQRGEPDARTTLLQMHQQAVFGYLRARLLEAADAEDLTQEVFLRCFQTRANFDDQILVRPWLLAIARNALREHVRRRAQRKEVAWTELCLELDTLNGPRPEQAGTYLEQLPNCLSGLGPSAREALDLHYRDRVQLQAIAERLKRSEGAVKLLLYRARQALRHCLETQVQTAEAHD